MLFIPHIVQEVLQEKRGLIWFDSSIRVTCQNLMSQLAPNLKERGVCMGLDNTHSVFATTDRRLYTFFPVNETMLKEKTMFQGGFIALINTRSLFVHFISKLVTCSLTQDCGAPVGALRDCDFKGNNFTEFANCHRYDQSVMNVLLLRYLKGNQSLYANKEACVTAERKYTNYFHLNTCQDKRE